MLAGGQSPAECLGEEPWCIFRCYCS